jgi:hypothetical protein
VCVCVYVCVCVCARIWKSTAIAAGSKATLETSLVSPIPSLPCTKVLANYKSMLALAFTRYAKTRNERRSPWSPRRFGDSSPHNICNLSGSNRLLSSDSISLFRVLPISTPRVLLSCAFFASRISAPCASRLTPHASRLSSPHASLSQPPHRLWSRRQGLEKCNTLYTMKYAFIIVRT